MTTYLVYSGELLWAEFATEREAKACIIFCFMQYGRANMRIVAKGE